jgi:nucleotide-binding universal stress UspA family protein
MYRSIMVPLDGSSFGEHALPLALSIARRSGASIQLVHVHSPITPVFVEGAAFLDTSLDTHIMEERRSYLNGILKRVQEAVPGVKVEAKVLEGGVSATLSKYADENKLDLIVMTTHARDPLARFWLGSVADELVRHVTMPLLLIHPQDGKPNLKSDLVLKHLMVTLDGTPLSEKVVHPAEELASLMGATVTLFRAIHPVYPTPYVTEGVPIGAAVQAVLEKVEVVQANLEKEAKNYLDTVAERFRERGLTADTLVGVDEQPAVAILDAARARDCDGIAIETHGRHGLSRMFLGSVADKVIRGSTVPVLVHRPTEK